MSSLSGFETQSEVEQRRQKRQEEWEKVRKAEDPEGESLKAFEMKIDIVEDCW